CLSERKDIFEEFTLYESSLTAEVKTVFTADSKALCDLLLKNGVSVIPANKEGTIRLSFAGIAKESIVSGVNKLCDILTQNCLKV
ncbi:MAG: hypothetical protein II802_02340, partial [Clostridia bacterium]|nr:hypothetical protein [Clostridia bacterium]